jgi:hypothetical protein
LKNPRRSRIFPFGSGEGLRLPRPLQVSRRWKAPLSISATFGDQIVYADAYELIEPKFRRSPAGKIEGYGLKIFP